MQISPASELAQDLQIQRRQGGEAENMRHFRQPGLARRFLAHSFDAAEESDRGVLASRTYFARQALPQCGLPSLVLADRALQPAERGALARRPRIEELRPVSDVLLDKLRDATRKVEPHDGVGVAKVALEPLVLGYETRVAERFIDAPGEHLRRERRILAHFWHQPPDLAPQPLSKIRKLDVGADSVAIGDCKLDTPRERRARHDDLRRRERTGTFLRETIDQLVEQGLEAVGKPDAEHRNAQLSRTRGSGSEPGAVYSA